MERGFPEGDNVEAEVKARKDGTSKRSANEAHDRRAEPRLGDGRRGSGSEGFKPHAVQFRNACRVRPGWLRRVHSLGDRVRPCGTRAG